MIRVVDTTLREGEQTPGVCFSRHTKLAIAELLDAIGVDVIEAGHPIVNEDTLAAVRGLAQRPFQAKIGAHARSLEQDVELAVACGVDFLGVFYCVSDERLSGVFRRSVAEASAEIARTIRLARSLHPELCVRYTPEDAVRSPFANVVDACTAAVQAGADVISVADTTGALVPGSADNLHDYVSRLKQALAARGCHPAIAVHCHDDRGLALANALDGIRAGAEYVDASVLGLGERAGIVDLATLLTALHERGETRFRLDLLVELYELVARAANLPIPVNQPIVGANAFTHCAGIHTHAALIDPTHYQSLDPGLFGRRPDFCLDHMSGRAAVTHALERAGFRDLPEEVILGVLADVKAVGRRGRRVEPGELRYMVANHCAEEVSSWER